MDNKVSGQYVQYLEKHPEEFEKKMQGLYGNHLNKANNYLRDLVTKNFEAENPNKQIIKGNEAKMLEK